MIRKHLFTALMLTLSTHALSDDYTQELYDIYCSGCHAVSASNAPQAFSADWAPIVQRKGLNTLVTNAVRGAGNMPPMGTCSECTIDDLRDIILYMTEAK
ncbi:MAG: c-type cytochrome [Bacterioplanes sp.]|nr:c-type cytochrome [Bacterioplanes sp.]